MNDLRHRSALSAAAACVAILVLGFVPSTAFSDEHAYVFELTAANTGTSLADDAAWGWWNPGKYDLWQAEDDDSAHIADARISVAGEDYTFFFAVELYPDLEATAELSDGGDGAPLRHRIETGIRAYDLGYGQFFQLTDAIGVAPFVGLTYLEIDERRSWFESLHGGVDRADSGLLGAVLGAEGGVLVADRWTLTGRLMARWARGDRSAELFLDDDGDGGPDIGDVDLEDKVDRSMWGAELALRWMATESLHLEGGWRHRDWSFNDGPGSFSGPFVRVIFGL